MNDRSEGDEQAGTASDWLEEWVAKPFGPRETKLLSASVYALLAVYSELRHQGDQAAAMASSRPGQPLNYERHVEALWRLEAVVEKQTTALDRLNGTMNELLKEMRKPR